MKEHAAVDYYMRLKADTILHTVFTCMIAEALFVAVPSAASRNACREGSAPPGHHCGACAAEAAGLFPRSDVTAGKVPSHHEHNTPQPAGIGLVTGILICWSSPLCILPALRERVKIIILGAVVDVMGRVYAEPLHNITCQVLVWCACRQDIIAACAIVYCGTRHPI